MRKLYSAPEVLVLYFSVEDNVMSAAQQIKPAKENDYGEF